MLKNHAVGIDLGSSRFAIAVVKQGGVEIISNEANYRQTPCIVTFNKHRTVGDEAKSKIKQNLKNSIFYPTRYIGDLTQQELKNENFFNFSESTLLNNQVQFKLEKEEIKKQKSSYQAIVALLNKVKKICELNNILCNDIVISIPSYFNGQQRQALLDAAYIADIKPLRIFDESTAHIMNYSVFRKEDLCQQNPRLVGFIDFGFSKTSFVLAKIWRNKAEIIYQKHDKNLGVRNLDQSVVNHYINFFFMYNSIDLTTSAKSMYRLFQNVEKQRVVFSSNKISPINIECIFEDHDLQVNLTLKDYMQIVRDVVVQFQEFCRSIKNELLYNKFNLKDIHSIERLGGGMRIPSFQDIVVKVFEIEKISKTLDADESIARGCAIQAAMLSPRYSVAKYDIKESLLYDIFIGLRYNDQENQKLLKFFPKGTHYNKQLSVKIQRELALNVEISEKIQDSYLKLLTADFDSVNKNSTRIMYIQLDRNGIVSIKKIQLKSQQKNKDQEKIEYQFKQKFVQELDENILQQYIQENKEYLQSENLEQQLQQIHYEYESLIYKTKDIIKQEDYQNLLTPQETATVCQVLDKHEAWFNTQGVGVQNEEILIKFKELKQSCEIFYSRKNKIDNIKEFVKEMQQNFDQLNTQNQSLSDQIQNQLIEINVQKLKNCKNILDEMNIVINNSEIHTIDKYNFQQQSKVFQEDINDVATQIDQVIQDIDDQQRDKKEV